MREERPFPLIVWEGSEQFRQEYEAAEQRLSSIVERFRRSEQGYHLQIMTKDIQFDRDGHPQAWVNASNPFLYKRVNEEQAIEAARKFGTCGWKSLDDLEELVDGKGPIFDSTMHQLGFRPHKKQEGRWVHLKEGEEAPTSEKEDKFETIEGEEAERLLGLRVMENDIYQMGRTFGIEVGSRGMIYIGLHVNPFAGTSAERMGELGRQLRLKGHLAAEQDGYRLDSRNVRLEGGNGVYIKALRPDESFEEVVWPATILDTRLFDLAYNLSDRFKSITIR